MSRDRRPNGIRGDTRSNGVFLVASFEVTRARAGGGRVYNFLYGD